MANFTSGDLLYNYSWTTTSGDSKFRGEPDHSLLNRHEGYEVLYMIQRLMGAWNLNSIAAGQRIEKMIRLAPSNYHSQANVMNWIDVNWNQY